MLKINGNCRLEAVDKTTFLVDNYSANLAHFLESKKLVDEKKLLNHNVFPLPYLKGLYTLQRSKRFVFIVSALLEN